MLKTFAFVLYLASADGEGHRYVLDSGLTADDCAHRLTLSQSVENPFNLDGLDLQAIIAACEEEQEI